MKRFVVMALVAVLGFGALAQDAVQPSSCTFTNVRDEAVQAITSGTFYQGATLLFTNCLARTTTNAVQGLDGVAVALSVGNLSTNIDYAATVISVTGGTWFCSVTVPSLSSFTAQVKVTDTNGNSYIYPGKSFSTSQSFFE